MLVVSCEELFVDTLCKLDYIWIHLCMPAIMPWLRSSRMRGTPEGQQSHAGKGAVPHHTSMGHGIWGGGKPSCYQCDLTLEPMENWAEEG